MAGELPDHERTALGRPHQPFPVHRRQIGDDRLCEGSRARIIKRSKSKSKVARPCSQGGTRIEHLRSRGEDDPDAGDRGERVKDIEHRRLGPVNVFDEDEQLLAFGEPGCKRQRCLLDLAGRSGLLVSSGAEEQRASGVAPATSSTVSSPSVSIHAASGS